MALKQQIDQDLKTAMLAGDKVLTTTLRGLKSAILNQEIAENKRDEGLPEETVLQLLTKESKKRQESADLYTQGGNAEKAEAELAEKKVIEKYLPEQASEEEIAAAVDKAIAETSAAGPQAMGQVIGKVKQQLGAAADGSVVARIAKERLR
jgi:uncharacterized protein YqeY